MSTKVVILNAGKPHRGDELSILRDIGHSNVFDWQLRSFDCSLSQITLVLGYESETFTEKYPDVDVVLNKDWETTGSAYSLLQVDLENITELWVCYGDILFRQSDFLEMKKSSSIVTIATDSHWKCRFSGRDERDLNESEKVIIQNNEVVRLGTDLPSDWANAEFVGLVRFTGDSLEVLKKLKNDKTINIQKMGLPYVLEILRLRGITISSHDVLGNWAEMNESQDIAHFILGTKAETLSRLRPVVKHATIEDQVSFTIAKWEDNKQEILDDIYNKFYGDKLVVRSSARSEDSFLQSNAGAYTSVLNVDINTDLETSILTVIQSYKDLAKDDQVLVQPMIQNVKLSGVAFTRTLDTLAPYYVINYEQSGSTEGITSGNSKQNIITYVQKDSIQKYVKTDILADLLIAMSEIEVLLGYDALDIEFAITHDDVVHILQVRPISILKDEPDCTESVIAMQRNAIKEWEAASTAGFNTLGTIPIFGQMPDWNPAEIIGTNPGELARTLYKRLILENVWATQRAQYGYRDVCAHSLLVSFSGKPYVDVRASFNSFIPASIPDDFAEKLVNFYSDYLIKNPQFHDKIEFEVIPTCVGLNFNKWKTRLSKVFSETEIRMLEKSLLEVTVLGVARCEKDLQSISYLEKVTDEIILKNQSPLEKIKTLLYMCKTKGTLPFAHLARGGFVAVTFLKEAEEVGLLSKQAKRQFLASLKTVSTQFQEDAVSVNSGDLDWSVFLSKYGHLRPGTYDITSPAYSDDPDVFLKPLINKNSNRVNEIVSTDIWDKEKKQVFVALRKTGINFSDDILEKFLRNAIEGREYAKFVFSKSLSNALTLLSHWGESIGLSRDTLSNIPIHFLLEDKSGLDSGTLNTLLTSVAAANREARRISSACKLPPLITCEDDFYTFTLNEDHPNYVGSNSIISECISLVDQDKEDMKSVEGKIIIIPQADPGYDWLFGYNIAGLITMFGGANSHMSIRSAELGIPAAIGVGEVLYEKLTAAKIIELDPVGATLRVLG